MPGAVNIGAALLLLVVIVSVALHSASATPPAVAEFAPQAQQIRQAPEEQTARFGNGAGGVGTATPPASPSPSPNSGLPAGALLLQCVGDPPRQIEDSQSPPCVPYWQGNNGGPTYRGVDGTTIRIAVYCGADDDIVHEGAFENFFNKRFELYGRHVIPQCEPYNNTGTSATLRADADQDYTDQVFAAHASPSSFAYDFYDELAKRGIIAATAAWSFETEPYMASRDPYIWQYEMANDEDFSNVGQWACSWLAGRTAAHAGSPTLAGEQRKFAIAFSNGNGGDPASTAPLVQRLQGCGVTPAANVTFTGGNSGSEQGAVVSLQSSGATTVLCLPQFVGDCLDLQRYSTAQEYFPEWVFTTYGFSDRSYELYQNQATQQMAHTFGLTFQPRQTSTEKQPWWWAIHEGDPGQANSHTDVSDFQEVGYYHSWLLLMSGIQMAGPDLTPRNFARGLHAAAFPNPPSPINEGAAGFAGGRHSMTMDAAVWWWSSTAPSPYADEGAGAICYVDHGARHPSGYWPPPPSDLLFQGPCDAS